MYKIAAEFEFGGHSPLGAHPQNVVLGYDVRKSTQVVIVVYNVDAIMRFAASMGRRYMYVTIA